MNKTNVNKNYKNKKLLKYSFYILLFIIILFILYKYKYIFIEKFDLTTITNDKIQTINTQLNTNNKNYIICLKKDYETMEDYIKSFYNYINPEIVIFNNINEIPDINNIDNYIFIQIIPDEILTKINDKNDNIYLINTEQMSRTHHRNKINTYPKNIKMLDYAKANMKYYDGYYVKFLSYQINYDEIYDLPKTKDICIITGLSEYRRHIVDSIINKGYPVDVISGWRKERDEKLFTYKILLNITYDNSIDNNYNIFESLRCDRCIFNRMIVISNKKEDMDLYYLKNYMIFEDYDKVADKAIEVLNNYDMYYKNLGLDTLDLNKLKVEPVSL
jgi:hypothetical protein